MFILAGLGNPGTEYKGTRHNIGFDIMEQLIYDYNLSAPVSKFKSLFSEGMISGRKVRLIQPQTYMNLSGKALIEIVNFYKVPLENVFVFYDELDLELGKVRVKKGGSHGGHNGIKSIDSSIGKEYNRIRFGISHPGKKSMVSSYVLNKFKEEEFEKVDSLVKSVSTNISYIFSGEKEKFMTKMALEFKEKFPSIEPEDKLKEKQNETA